MPVYLNTSQTALTGMLELSADHTQVCLVFLTLSAVAQGTGQGRRGVRVSGPFQDSAAVRSEPHTLCACDTPLGQVPGR